MTSSEPAAPADPYDQIPEALRFEIAPRPPRDAIRFAIGDQILTATRPLEYTMLMLASAMSGMSDGGDRAYAIMTFCHAAFDGGTRELVKELPSEELLELIRHLCEQWDVDTTEWEREQANNRADRRAAAKRPVRRR